MSFEPRMRGRRFLRPTKKKSKRSKERPPALTYTNEDTTDLNSVQNNILNAVDHLGNQRFALPPFAEHFQRWTTDLKSLLDEFKSQFPDVADTHLQGEIEELLTRLQNALSKHSEAEVKKSDKLSTLQRDLAQREIELSKLERNYRSNLHGHRRQHNDANRKIRGEIETLDKKRIQILRRKPNIIQRLMRKSNTGLENATTALESKKTQLRDDEQSFEVILQRSRNEYEQNRQTLISQIDLLKHEIKNSSETMDDALQIRNQTCQQIRSAIDRAMLRAKSKNQEDTHK